jgi:hypothetical protein
MLGGVMNQMAHRQSRAASTPCGGRAAQPRMRLREVGDALIARSI